MTTRAQMLARRWSSPVVVATIDSIGDALGLWRFCSRVPEYAAGSAVYKPWFTHYGLQLSEETNPLGGVAAASELVLSMIDPDDVLLALLRTEARPYTVLSADLTAGAATVTLNRALPSGTSLIFLPTGEAITIESLVSGSTYNIGRGALGTLAAAHRAADRVHLYTTHLYGRRVRLYTTFGDAGYSQAEEANGEVGGGWSVDRIALENLNVWTFGARSQLRFLDRLVMRSSFHGFVSNLDGERLFLEGDVAADGKRRLNQHFGDRIFFKINGEEIIRVRAESPFTGSLQIDVRGAVGTVEEAIEVDDEIRQVYVADPSGDYGSFRYQQPGSETSSLSTGTWIVTSHPVPIILAILTSSADIENTAPDNYGTNTGNYSSLTGGVGLGLPLADGTSEIDIGSFLAVWRRTFSYALDHFVFDEVMTGREAIDQICRLCGYDLHTAGGQLRLDLHRASLASEASVTLDDAQISTDEGEGEGNEVPIIRWALDTSLTAGSVVFHLKTSRGVPVESVFSDVDFPQIFGNSSGYYEQEDQRITIDAPFVRADADGGEPEVIRQRALGLLFRYRRPLIRLEVKTDLSWADLAVGSRVLVTNAQIPDLATGTRGVTDLPGKILTKRVVVSEGEVGCHFEVLLDNSGTRAGAICPSAMITSVVMNGSDWDVSVEANRYTDPVSTDLPASDAAAFSVGERVRLVDRTGLPYTTTPDYQEITAIGSNLITIDGNFGGSGAFAPGEVLEFVDRDDQVAAQYDNFVSLADEATRTVGASNDAPWTITEP